MDGGHIARFKDNRWTIRVTEWARRQEIPKTRWRDNLNRHHGPVFTPRIIARDQRLWRQSREGFPPYKVIETLVINVTK